MGYFDVVFRGICWGFGIGAGKPTEIFAQKSLPGYSKLFQGSYYKPKRPKKPKMVKIETPPLMRIRLYKQQSMKNMREKYEKQNRPNFNRHSNSGIT